MPEGVTLSASFGTSPERLDEWRRRLSTALGVIVASTADPSTDTSEGAPAEVTLTDSSTTICYFDGDFGSPRGDPPDSVPDYSRIVVVVDGGGLPTIAAQGFVDELPIIDPNS